MTKIHPDSPSFVFVFWNKVSFMQPGCLEISPFQVTRLALNSQEICLPRPPEIKVYATSLAKTLTICSQTEKRKIHRVLEIRETGEKYYQRSQRIQNKQKQWMVENATNQKKKVHKKQVDLAIKRSWFIYYNSTSQDLKSLTKSW